MLNQSKNALLIKLSLVLCGTLSLISTAAFAKEAAKAGRQRTLSGEKTIRSGGKNSPTTNLDFDATSIGGERKTPLGSLISQTKSDKDFDFVKIRYHWHPEMVQSATVLDSSNQ